MSIEWSVSWNEFPMTSLMKALLGEFSKFKINNVQELFDYRKKDVKKFDIFEVDTELAQCLGDIFSNIAFRHEYEKILRQLNVTEDKLKGLSQMAGTEAQIFKKDVVIKAEDNDINFSAVLDTGFTMDLAVSSKIADKVNLELLTYRISKSSSGKATISRVYNYTNVVLIDGERTYNFKATISTTLAQHNLLGLRAMRSMRLVLDTFSYSISTSTGGQSYEPTVGIKNSNCTLLDTD